MVEVTAEPAGLEPRVGVSDLPVVAGREVRLVRVRVSDRGEHGQLALGVQRVEGGCGWMPAQSRVLGEDEPRVGQRELRTQPAVVGIAVREEDGQRVDASVEEDRDEHGVGRPGRERLRDAVVERARRERGRPVDGDRHPEGAGQEVAPVEPRPGGERHARLDVGQPCAGLRGGLAQEGGT